MGTIESQGEIQIDNPTNFFDNSTYSFTFLVSSFVPKGGYIKIDFPTEITFNIEIALISKTCFTNKCTIQSNQ